MVSKVPEGHHARGTTLHEALRGNLPLRGLCGGPSEGSAGVSPRVGGSDPMLVTLRNCWNGCVRRNHVGQRGEEPPITQFYPLEVSESRTQIMLAHFSRSRDPKRSLPSSSKQPHSYPCPGSPGASTQHMRAHAHTRTNVRTRAPMSTHTHTQMPTRARPCPHTHTHTQTRAQPLPEYGGHLFSEAVFLFILGLLW